ncbi:MAG: FlaD/FlaE family flagellar protein, partial [Methermicoccaceae archaeon]
FIELERKLTGTMGNIPNSQPTITEGVTVPLPTASPIPATSAVPIDSSNPPVPTYTLQVANAERYTASTTPARISMPPSMPVLDVISSDFESRRIAMKWIEFLVGRVGTNNLPELLDHYVELRWISERARDILLTYAEGMEPLMGGDDWKLSADDNIRSFWFAWRLAGHQIEGTSIAMVKREIGRIERMLDLSI